MIAEYFAGRGRDHEFCLALAESRLVDRAMPIERLAATDLTDTDRARIAAKISAHFSGTT
jgi:hypothetical protein